MNTLLYFLMQYSEYFYIVGIFLIHYTLFFFFKIKSILSSAFASCLGLFLYQNDIEKLLDFIPLTSIFIPYVMGLFIFMLSFFLFFKVIKRSFYSSFFTKILFLLGSTLLFSFYAEKVFSFSIIPSLFFSFITPFFLLLIGFFSIMGGIFFLEKE
jgi:hypothetical protein